MAGESEDPGEATGNPQLRRRAEARAFTRQQAPAITRWTRPNEPNRQKPTFLSDRIQPRQFRAREAAESADSQERTRAPLLLRSSVHRGHAHEATVARGRARVAPPILSNRNSPMRSKKDLDIPFGLALAAAVLGAFGFYFAIPALKWSALIFAVVWLVLMASVGHSKFSDIDHGVVMVDSIARASDSVNAPSRYTQPLPPGTEVKVLARQDDWVKVQLNDGRDAWLRATQIHTI